MNRTIVLLASFAVATFASAQSPAPPASPPTSTSPTTNPMTHPRTSDRDADSRNSANARSANDFESLDRQGRGYVTREEVSGDSWLMKNFSTCDKDGDGQVTRAEYAGCPGRQ